MKPKIIEIRKGILEKNDITAHKLRTSFEKNKIVVVNFVASPGSGKTELLTVLSKNLIEKGYKVSVVVGDLATDNDAKRIKNSGADTYQINTNGNCHLDSNMIEKAINKVHWKESDFLFIENVGNLVCPACYDLGESLRIVLMSVTEGEDKPLKYPTIFNSADVCVISKMDLVKATKFNLKLAKNNVFAINPTINIIESTAKSKSGFKGLVDYLISKAE